MSAPGSEPRTGIDWGRVLKQIEQTLTQSLALAGETPPRVSVPAREEPVTIGPLRQLDERQERCRTRLAEAERAAQAADAALASEAQALEEWLQALRASREKLATWAGGKVE